MLEAMIKAQIRNEQMRLNRIENDMRNDWVAKYLVSRVRKQLRELEDTLNDIQAGTKSTITHTSSAEASSYVEALVHELRNFYHRYCGAVSRVFGKLASKGAQK